MPTYASAKAVMPTFPKPLAKAVMPAFPQPSAKAAMPTFPQLPTRTAASATTTAITGNHSLPQAQKLCYLCAPGRQRSSFTAPTSDWSDKDWDGENGRGRERGRKDSNRTESRKKPRRKEKKIVPRNII